MRKRRTRLEPRDDRLSMSRDESRALSVGPVSGSPVRYIDTFDRTDRGLVRYPGGCVQDLFGVHTVGQDKLFHRFADKGRGKIALTMRANLISE